MSENAGTIEAPAVDFIELTADIVSAYVSKNSVRLTDLADLIASTYAALAGLGTSTATAAPAVEKLTPYQIRKSITPDALISFIDDKPYKTLKRHLTGAGLTFEEYRERFGLPRDYPTTAANYSAQRSALVMNIGLGQQRKKAAPKVAEPAKAVSDRPRKAKHAAEA